MRNTPQVARRKRSEALSRRTFLRGAGVTMALPWLESLSGFGVGSARAAVTPVPPQRFAVLFMGTGISPGRWWAKGAGAGMELSESLAPLEPLKTKINVIDGLFNKAATGQGIHPAMTGNMLSGVPIQKGSIIHGGITVDQVLANRIGQETPQPSMVLASERAMTGFHESNFSNAYSSHISWQSADSPVPNEMYPSLGGGLPSPAPPQIGNTDGLSSDSSNRVTQRLSTLLHAPGFRSTAELAQDGSVFFQQLRQPHTVSPTALLNCRDGSPILHFRFSRLAGPREELGMMSQTEAHLRMRRAERFLGKRQASAKQVICVGESFAFGVHKGQVVKGQPQQRRVLAMFGAFDSTPDQFLRLRVAPLK